MSEANEGCLQQTVRVRMFLRDGWGRCHDTLPRKSPLQTYEEMLWRRLNIANRRLWSAIQELRANTKGEAPQ